MKKISWYLQAKKDKILVSNPTKILVTDVILMQILLDCMDMIIINIPYMLRVGIYLW